MEVVDEISTGMTGDTYWGSGDFDTVVKGISVSVDKKVRVAIDAIARTFGKGYTFE